MGLTVGWELPCFETWAKLTDLGACLLEIYRNVFRLFSQSSWRGSIRKVTDVQNFKEEKRWITWPSGRRGFGHLRSNSWCTFLYWSLSLTSSSFQPKVPSLKAVSQETKSCHLYLSNPCELVTQYQVLSLCVLPHLILTTVWGWECRITDGLSGMPTIFQLFFFQH